MISDEVTEIGESAFCLTVTSIKLHNKITKIVGAETFSGCTRLTKVTLPSALAGIGQMAFAFCPLIENVYSRGSESDRKNIKIDL